MVEFSGRRVWGREYDYEHEHEEEEEGGRTAEERQMGLGRVIQKLKLRYGSQETVVKTRMGNIGTYYNERLMRVFPGVADPPGVLRNSKNSPLYLLCFAVANPLPRAKDTALKIAQYLLRDIQ